MRFRSEITFGEGYREVVPVLCWETFELGNSDILLTLANGLLKNSPLKKQLLSFSEDLNKNGFIADFPEEQQLQFFTEVISEINSFTKKNIKYCLWLADLDGVKSYCLNDTELSDDDIDVYEESDVILSNIDFDGCLYGYETLPKCISTYAEWLKTNRENSDLEKE